MTNRTPRLEPFALDPFFNINSDNPVIRKAAARAAEGRVIKAEVLDKTGKEALADVLLVHRSASQETEGVDGYARGYILTRRELMAYATYRRVGGCAYRRVDVENAEFTLQSLRIITQHRRAVRPGTPFIWTFDESAMRKWLNINFFD